MRLAESPGRARGSCWGYSLKPASGEMPPGAASPLLDSRGSRGAGISRTTGAAAGGVSRTEGARGDGIGNSGAVMRGGTESPPPRTPRSRISPEGGADSADCLISRKRGGNGGRSRSGPACAPKAGRGKAVSARLEGVTIRSSGLASTPALGVLVRHGRLDLRGGRVAMTGRSVSACGGLMPLAAPATRLAGTGLTGSAPCTGLRSCPRSAATGVA